MTSIRRCAGCDQTGSTPHHSAMNWAMTCVVRSTEAVDSLVDAVDALGGAAVVQHRDAVVERVDAGIEIGGDEPLLERFAGHRPVRGSECRLRRRSRFQPIAFGKEAVPGDARRIVGKKAVAAGEGGDAGFDLGSRLGRGRSGQEGDAAVDAAP